MRKFATLAIALIGVALLTPYPTQSETPTTPKLVPKYVCRAADLAPVMVDACGTRVCRYTVFCIDLSTTNPVDFEDSAYCPARSVTTCAPYAACAVNGDDTRPGLQQQFASQCDKFRETGARD